MRGDCRAHVGTEVEGSVAEQRVAAAELRAAWCRQDVDRRGELGREDLVKVRAALREFSSFSI